MTVYNKLVRDKIPDIIRAQGQTPIYRILEEEEYRRCLEEKLSEEVAEFQQDKAPEELADILTVVLALAETLGVSPEELEKIYRKKLEERGGFQGKIFLVGKEG